MLDGKRRDDVQPGTIVKVALGHNQNAGKLTQGIVKKVLTSSSVHPHGIKVLLESGIIGRVKLIIKENPQQRENNTSNSTVVLPANEDQTTEFKATFKFDLKRHQHTGVSTSNKEVEKSISKTVAAFMNSKGGTLYIGVDDDGQVLGLEQDYKTLEKPTSDRFRLVIKNSLQGFLKNKIIFEHIELDFPLINGKEICRIKIYPSSIPVFLQDDGKEECYVRVDNESKPYDYQEFLEYWQRHSSK